MIGLIALRKGFTNDFTAAAENSGPTDFFQITSNQNVLIEQKVFNGFFYNLDAQMNGDL